MGYSRKVFKGASREQTMHRKTVKYYTRRRINNYGFQVAIFTVFIFDNAFILIRIELENK